MIIDLERKVQPSVQCVRVESSNASEILAVIGKDAYIRSWEQGIIAGNKEEEVCLRKGEYLVNDDGWLSVATVNEVLVKYNYIDFEQGQQLEYDLESSVEARAAFFAKVKDFFGE